MAECQQNDDDLAIDTPGYKPPAQKSLAEIQELDAEDASLRRYKESLLPNAGSGGGKKVVVKSLSVVIEGREDITLDLTGDLSKLKDRPIAIKEGTEYKLKIVFDCSGEIVPGLKFFTSVTKMAFTEKLHFMVGSYGPSSPDKSHEFLTDIQEAPNGMIARGKYSMKSVFLDDDKDVHLKWHWVLEIVKHWPEEKEKK